MSRSLYEIDKDILALMDPETGEIADMELLDQLEMEREAKIENVALWQKNENAYIEALRAEKKSIEERIKQAEKSAERRAEWLKKATGGEPFTTPKCTLTFRTATSVEVVELDLIPEEFMRTKVTTEPDKTAIKNAIKGGAEIPGAKLVTDKSMTVK